MHGDNHGRGGLRVTDFAPRFRRYERYCKAPNAGADGVAERVAARAVGQCGEQELTRCRRSHHIAFLGLAEEICLTTNITLTYVLGEEDFVLSETKYLVLTHGAPLESTAERFLTSTEGCWRPRPQAHRPLRLVEECLRLMETTMNQPEAGPWKF